MELIADGLLIAAALVAAFYCFVLSRRMVALSSLDTGLGAAIAALSAQVDGMQGSLDAARKVSGNTLRDMAALTARAEIAAGRLEMLLATLHDSETGSERALSDSAIAARARRGPVAGADPTTAPETTAGAQTAAGVEMQADPEAAQGRQAMLSALQEALVADRA